MRRKKLPIFEPESFHLRRRILDVTGVAYRECEGWVELDGALDALPDAKRRLIEAALSCRLEWREVQGLDAREKVAIGVAAMDVDAFRKKQAKLGAMEPA